jgi:uncharacterized protein (DUF1684 family)
MNTIIAISLFMVFLPLQTDSDYISEIKTWQSEMNAEFASPKESPLEEEDRLSFTGLDFYKIDSTYRVKAKLKLDLQKKKFAMKTTTSRLPVYANYGVASFKLHGRKFKINIYQNVALSLKEEYKDYLFMLFTDKTSGVTSYAGGRYLDLRIPKKGEDFIIDFNKAYNPYCAYSHKYSCPIPPEEDYFDIEIKAGVKKWE